MPLIRDTSREYPKCIYKNGKIGDDSIDVQSEKEEMDANLKNYFDCRYGPIVPPIFTIDSQVKEKKRRQIK